MTRAAVLLGLLLLGASSAGARAAEFELKAELFDVVKVAGVDKPFRGTIEKEDQVLLVFVSTKKIRYRWPRTQVSVITRKCTLAEAYRRATEAAGKDPRAHLRLYEACVKAKLDKEAIAELRKAIEVDPKYLPAYDKLLEAARAAKDLDMELGALEAADRGGVATAGMLIRTAEIYVRLGMAAEADVPLNKALAIDPFNVKAETRLAMLGLIRGKPDRAEKHIRTMLRRDPKNPTALVALGQLEFARGNMAKAAEAFGKAAQSSKSPAAAASLGAIAQRQGDIARAARYFKEARVLAPDFVPALAGEALVTAHGGGLKKAAELLDRAAALQPKRPAIAVARGYVHELAGEPAAALGKYEAALEVDQANVYALAGTGRCHRRQGDAAKARAGFLQALSLRPGFVPALRGLGRLALAKNPSRAAEHFRKLVASGPATPEDHAALAGALIRLQRFGEAAAQLAKAGSDNVHGRIGLGFLAYAQGNVDEAITHFKAAVTLGDYNGYAAGAIRRIRLAESRLAWSETFQRDPPDDAEVRNGWTEVEPPGVSISISKNALVIDGKPGTDERIARLSRPEGGSLVSITAEGSTGSEAKSFVGVFVAPRGGKPVLFGRTGSGQAAILYPGLNVPKEFRRKIPQGKFTLGIEIVNQKKGIIRLLVNGRRLSGATNTSVPHITGAEDFDVGLFALPQKGQNVNCSFHTVKIVRSK